MFNELLVLGQIPGTNIEITFNQLVALFCLAVLRVIWHRNPRLIRYMVAKAQFWAVIFKLRFQQPAGLIGHIG
jgi:hypothetical protein